MAPPLAGRSPLFYIIKVIVFAINFYSGEHVYLVFTDYCTWKKRKKEKQTPFLIRNTDINLLKIAIVPKANDWNNASFLHHKKRKEKSKSLYNKQRRQVAAIYIGTARYKENHHLFLLFLIWVEQLVVTATAEGPSPVMVASPSRDGSVARSGGRCTNCAAEASP